MTGRDIVLKAIERQPTPRPPVAWFGGGMWSIHQHGSTFEKLSRDPEGLARMNIETFGAFRPDIVYVGSGYNNLYGAAMGNVITYLENGAPDVAQPFIESVEDVKRVNPAALRAYPVVNTVWKAARIVKKEIGPEAVVTMTSWAPFTLAGQMVGAETYLMAMYENKDLVHAASELTTETLKVLFEPVIDDGTLDMLTIADGYASGDVLSRAHFIEFVLPHLQAFIGWAAQKGIKTLLHICGDTGHFLDQFPKTGAAVASVDYKVAIQMLKARIGGKMCVAGNVNPVAVLDSGTPDQVRQAAADCLEHGAGGGGYILMPGCDLPHTVPVENVLAFLETGRNYTAH